MTLQETIYRLQTAFIKLKKLEEHQFNYNSVFVRMFDYKKSCPTQACVAGYYPVWFPKSNFIYSKENVRNRMELIVRGFDYCETEITLRDAISDELCDFHGLSPRLIDVLFFGEAFYYPPTNSHIHNNSGADLAEVIIRFETVLNGLKNGKIPPDLGFVVRD